MTKRPLVVVCTKKRKEKVIPTLKASGSSGCKNNGVCIHICLFCERAPYLLPPFDLPKPIWSSLDAG